MKITSGMNLRQAIEAARALGVTVRPRPGTDEIDFLHPAFVYPVRIKGTRKDCPRALTTALRRIKR